jgi:hypothetical protein
MWRVVSPSALGGPVVIAIILLSLVMLIGLGASFGEALYLSVSGLIVIGYAVTSWRLRRER